MGGRYAGGGGKGEKAAGGAGTGYRHRIPEPDTGHRPRTPATSSIAPEPSLLRSGRPLRDRSAQSLDLDGFLSARIESLGFVEAFPAIDPSTLLTREPRLASHLLRAFVHRERRSDHGGVLDADPLREGHDDGR